MFSTHYNRSVAWKIKIYGTVYGILMPTPPIKMEQKAKKKTFCPEKVKRSGAFEGRSVQLRVRKNELTGST